MICCGGKENNPLEVRGDRKTHRGEKDQPRDEKKETLTISSNNE